MSSKITNVIVPEVGESITTAIIKDVFKGEYIEISGVVAVIETDKITSEVESDVSGKITLKCTLGEEVSIGQVIATIDTSKQNPKQTNDNNKNNNNSNEEVRNVSGEQNPSSVRNEDSKDVLLKSQKQDSGYQEAVTEHRLTSAAGLGTVGVEDLLNLVIDNSLSSEVTVSPNIDLILKKNNVDPICVVGTGRSHRITEDDLLEMQTQKQGQPSTPQQSTQQPTPQQSTQQPTPQQSTQQQRPNVYTSTPVSRVRVAISDKLLKSRNNKVATTTFNEVNMSRIMPVLKREKVSIVSLFVKAVNIALRDYPQCASYIESGSQIFNNIDNISFAMAIDSGGVITPTIKGCSRKSVDAISHEVKESVLSIKKNGYNSGDISGGAMTITNGGVFGSMLSTPVIPFMHQCAILGLHNVTKRPICSGEEIISADVMYVALTYDHLIVDGKDAVGFLCRIKQLVEQHELMLFAI